MLSKSKPIIPDAAIIENNSTYQVDVIDSTSEKQISVALQMINGDFLSRYIRNLNKDGVAWCTYCECELK